MNKKREINKYFSSNLGMSLLETMIGMMIFVLIFTFTFKAYAPTATDAHNLLRGVTVAMNLCNWYLNDLEKQINYNGSLPEHLLGERNVTGFFHNLNTDEQVAHFSDLALLRNLHAVSKVELNGNLYTMQIQLDWGAHGRDRRRPHSYSLSRLKVKPGF